MRIHVLLIALAATACSGEDTESSPDAAPVYRATWYQDVAPILANRCMTCHQAGGIGPFTLTEYDSAVENSARAVKAIDDGIMPPFDAREEADCTPRFGWVDDPRLTPGEKATLKAWIEDGHPLGTVAEIPKPPNHDLANVTKTLKPTTSFTTSGDRDQFICFVLDPQVTAQVEWLTGLQVKPDNDLVVHHAVITEVFPGAEHDALVAQRGIGQPWDCSADGGGGNFPVHVWTPGNQPYQTTDDIAIPVLGGSKFIMQIHYHPAMLTNAPDATAIDIRLTPTWPKRMYFVAAFGNEFQAPGLLPGPNDPGGNPTFMVPKNVKDHPEHMRTMIPDLSGFGGDVRLYSANPHMHLIGTHISATLERPAARGTDPMNECVANGGWNFDWQRTYLYNAPLDKLPTIQGGDIIDIKCEWDNTISNPFVQRMMKDAGLVAPIDVFLGEQTTNEMCLEIFGLSVPAPPPQIALATPTAFGELMDRLSKIMR